MVGIAGVTAIETKIAGVTVSVLEPLIAPEVAAMLVLPTATLVASPCALTLAMVESAVLQVTAFVRFRVLPSLYVPVAVNCSVVPSAKDGFKGVTAIDTSTGCPTVRVAEAVMEPEVAVMVAVPMPTPVANPLDPIRAMLVRDDVQFTVLVRFCVLPSL
jgi:hypothetical protein